MVSTTYWFYWCPIQPNALLQRHPLPIKHSKQIHRWLAHYGHFYIFCIYSFVRFYNNFKRWSFLEWIFSESSMFNILHFDCLFALGYLRISPKSLSSRNASCAPGERAFVCNYLVFWTTSLAINGTTACAEFFMDFVGFVAKGINSIATSFHIS